MIWLLGPMTRLDLPGETPCVAAPATLVDEAQIFSVRSSGKRVLLQWDLAGAQAESKRSVERLATTTAARVLVWRGRWLLLRRAEVAT